MLLIIDIYLINIKPFKRVYNLICVTCTYKVLTLLGWLILICSMLNGYITKKETTRLGYLLKNACIAIFNVFLGFT